MLNSSSEAAIAAMSRLAEVYHRPRASLTAAEIAESRRLRKPFVAKILTLLSQAELVTGVPGPRGGYRLAREPAEISLQDIASCFERGDAMLACPFGPGYCGNHAPCPIHHEVVELHERAKAFLMRTSLAVFHPPSSAAAQGEVGSHSSGEP